jgi:hypothetical protein
MSAAFCLCSFVGANSVAVFMRVAVILILFDIQCLVAKLAVQWCKTVPTKPEATCVTTVFSCTKNSAVIIDSKGF